MIKAEIIGHSLSPQGEELISVLATFPRIILAEVNTHRMLSKNTSSSRAIPFLKMVETVKNNPFIPIAWQEDHKGMQGTKYLDTAFSMQATQEWLKARDYAVIMATQMNSSTYVTKQLTNRLLEPFMWTTMLITGSKSGWENFFRLRCPSYVLMDNGRGDNKTTHKSWKDLVETLEGRDNTDESVIDSIRNYSTIERLQVNTGQAEIHIMYLAEKIWDAKNESTPKQLKAGEWHIPFEDKISRFANIPLDSEVTDLMIETNILHNTIFTSVAMGARTSYTTVGEEKEINPETLIALHDRLLTQEPPHSSPFEHCTRAMSDEEYNNFLRGEFINGEVTSKDNLGWCYNSKGFIPYRYLVDNSLTL